MPVAVNPTNGSLLASVVSGGGGGTQYAEGATTSPGTGTLAIGRYNLVAPTLTDGELYGLQLDSSGNLKVTGSLSVGGTTDNSAFTAGSSTGTPAMGFYHSTIDAVTDGRAAAVAITANRAQHVNLRDSSGTEIGTTTNQINTLSPGKVDSGNSSTSTLTANSTFTGTGVSTLGYTFVQVYVFSDQSSAANGLKIEFSSDNTNWNDSSLFTFTAGSAAPNDGQIFGAPARGQYVRLVYTNGGTNQTTFRLQTLLKTGAQNGDMVTMITVPNSTNHAQLTKSSIVGLTTAGGGAFVDVKVNPSGALTTASNTFDGNGTAITSNSTTTTATTGLDMNIRSILNTAPTTPGFLDIKGADGNVFVRQTTAANLNATVVGTGTFAVQSTPVAPTTVFNGKTTVTTAGTRVVLASSQAVKSVAIKALTSNTGTIYVGSSTVSSTNGFQLAAGDTISLDIANLNTVNIDSSVNGEGVTYVGTN